VEFLTATHSTGPEGSRSLMIPDFKTIGTRMW